MADGAERPKEMLGCLSRGFAGLVLALLALGAACVSSGPPGPPVHQHSLEPGPPRWPAFAVLVALIALVPGAFFVKPAPDRGELRTRSFFLLAALLFVGLAARFVAERAPAPETLLFAGSALAVLALFAARATGSARVLVVFAPLLAALIVVFSIELAGRVRAAH